MRHVGLGVVAAICFAAPGDVLAKAGYMSKGGLIQSATIIAVVEVTEVDDATAKGKHWTYRQAAHALTVRTLKGELPMHFTIHAKKDFICARASYESKTRYLVFLRQEGELYTTVNHHLGQFKATDGKIMWFSDDRSLALGEQRFDEVIEEVDSELNAAR